MAVKLNRAAVRHANSLIDAGKVDRENSWTAPTPAEENMLLGDPPDWANYKKWFLGVDDKANEETKGAWKYPIGKHGELYRSALEAIRQRAGQQHLQDLFNAAGKLLDAIDAKAQTPPASRGAWWEIKARAQAQGNTLYIYGDIGDNPFDEESWSAIELVRALDALDGMPLVVRINSWGGSVADGLAMYNALDRYAGPVQISIDAQAASIASLIAMAGDSVDMAANAMLMIHAPWSAVAGNAVDMREAADMLDSFAGAMLPCYATRVDRTQAAEWLADGKDHWFTAQQALDSGLVDSISEASREAAHFARNSRFHQPERRAHTMATRVNEPTTGDPNNSGGKPAASAGGAPSTAEPTASNVVSLEDARNGVHAEVQARNKQVRSVFALHRSIDGVSELESEILSDPTITMEQAQNRLLAKLGEGTQALGRDTGVVVDARDKFRAGIGNAIMARAGLKLDKPDTGNEFRGYTLLEVCRASLHRANIRTDGMRKMDVVAEAFTMTDSDIAELTANVANKFLLKGWDEAPETFQQWTQPGVLPDFKVAKRVGLNLFDSLDERPEGSEYKYGSLSDRGETIALATYGKLLAITRQAIINDDLHALSKTPMLMGRAAKRTIGNLVYAILTGNPKMSDGIALFNAAHKNLAGTAAALDSNTINDMMVAMATQKDPDSKATALNIPLKNVIVPMALKAKAMQVANSEFMVEAANVNVRQPNIVKGAFNVIADARLDANSTTAYYGTADAGAFDGIEVAYLDGQNEPFLEQQRGFEIDGIAYKVRIDCGVSPLDFRSFQKNAGA